MNFRNALTDNHQQVEVQPGQTVQQAVEASGLIAAGNPFSVRDKDGQVVDNREATDFTGLTLSVGLPGDDVIGGSTCRN
ncbi:hypothetical protein DMB66_18795 [Actinoplanes sp. ATCC 53533]|nr:hypothetical protein DMB66_18795 [Actinoplanes sp. ATCC 53533]